MAKIVDLREYRKKTIEQKSFGSWKKRFGETYGSDTGFKDLSDKTLFLLATPGEKSALAYYEFIMGTMELGEALKFYYLEKEEQLRVMDMHLFLADQIRFEMMRRLGWIDNYACQDFTLLHVVQKFDKVKARCRGYPPNLSDTHAEFESFTKLIDGDKEMFIRRMLPKALEAFKQLLES